VEEQLKDLMDAIHRTLAEHEVGAHVELRLSASTTAEEGVVGAARTKAQEVKAAVETTCPDGWCWSAGLGWHCCGG